MTAPSPTAASGALVTFTIKVEGKEIDGAMQVVAVDTWLTVNRIPKARLALFDGNAAAGTFPLSASETFIPGNKVEIRAGYDDETSPIFTGLIVRQSLDIDRTRGPKLIVELTDLAARMTLARRNALFEKIKDSDLIGNLISANGLAKEVAATKTVHEEIVQYYATDWDLMLLRAEQNGMVVIAAGGKVTVKVPNAGQAPVLTLTFGESILDLSLDLDATEQYAAAAIKSFTWDIATQKRIEAAPAGVSVSEPGNLSSAQLAKVFDIKRFDQQTGAPIEKGALTDWSSAQLRRSRLAKIRGQVRFQGSALAAVGKVVMLAGLGARFNGKAWVGGVHHHIADGGWQTTVEIGLSPRWFAAEMPRIAAPAAAGQLPPIEGLQTGIVKRLAKDPQGEYRVLVSLPLLQDDAKGVWARLATFYASNKIGAVFYPEIGDEVVVAFMNQDPRYPVILGSLHSKKLPPPYVPKDDKNAVKALVTASQLTIRFNETNKVIEIETPGKHLIKLDDKADTLELRDGNKNRVTLAKAGITLESGGNLTLKAKGNISVQAGGNLNQTAKVNAALEGLQVAVKAKAKLAASGGASAELTSTGMLTIRGTMVNIN